MENEFVPYKQALALKELGFDEGCLGYSYKNKFHIMDEFISETENPMKTGVMIPLYQQAFRWFREKHFYLSYVCAPYAEYDEFYFRIRHVGNVLNEGQLESCESQVYKSYAEAELACLEKLIEIVKKYGRNTD